MKLLRGEIVMKNFSSRWINSERPGTIYYIRKDGFSQPIVEMIQTDGYTTKLKMNLDQLFDFEGNM